MKLVAKGIEIECSKAVKGSDYIKLYNGADIIAEFRGIADFGGYELIDGGWSIPEPTETERLDAVEAALLEVILNG